MLTEASNGYIVALLNVEEIAMHYANKLDPFGFLTGQRERAIWKAIEAANKRHQAVLSTSAHVHEHMSNRGKAFETREWGIAHIVEALSGDDGVKRRQENNTDGVMIDNIYFLHVKMIHDPEQPPPEPHTIVRARQRQKVNQLSYLDDIEDPPKEIAFHKLCFILVGYIRSGGLITSLFFVDQSVETPLVRPLTSGSSTVHKEREAKQPPKPIFKPKSDNDRKDKAE
jgi:hypothetical protein